jgi:hypothetical protein
MRHPSRALGDSEREIERERERERTARENLAVNVFQQDTKVKAGTRVQVDGLQSAALQVDGLQSAVHLNARTTHVIGLNAHKERRATHVQKLAGGRPAERGSPECVHCSQRKASNTRSKAHLMLTAGG